MQINTLRLRAMVGWLGMLLPLIVLTLSLIFVFGLPDSISATYYLDPTITPFMIILGSAGLLLISYKGYDKHDDIICTLAGISALCICLFPCNTLGLTLHFPQYSFPTQVGTFQIGAEISGWIHNITAVLFFGLLSYNSLFLFTKSSLILKIVCSHTTYFARNSSLLNILDVIIMKKKNTGRSYYCSYL